MGYHLRPFPDSALAKAAERFAVASVLVLLIAILATRSGKVQQLHGVGGLVLACIIAAAALAVAAVAAVEMWNRGYRGLGPLFRTCLLSIIVLAYPGYLTVLAVRLPVLNDISTDIEDPPSFSRSRLALDARDGHVPLTLEPRRRIAQLQAYPAIRPVIIEADAQESFETVKEAVRSLRWRIIEEIRPGGRAGLGRIDIVTETRLLRFRDDVTIRIRPQGAQTRVDIRSASRIGRHDLGANADRIRRLIDEINAFKE